MHAVQTCAQCGVPLDQYALEGTCPRCMLSAGLLGAEQNRSGEADDSVAGPGDPFSLSSNIPLGRFGQYELLEEIAHGGMGVVYRARQLYLNRSVAVKMLLLGRFSNVESIQRFRREASAVAALQHPNVVAIHEVGEIEGQHFFSMDYVEGRSLAALVRENPLPARVAAIYCRSVAEAIAYTHARGIIHRDLKPSNVLIDLFDQVRITDFGLAKQLDGSSDLTLTNHVLGSPNYLPPELATGKQREASVPSDVYSIGAILYECLTGRPPFLAESLQETLLKIRDAEVPRPQLLNARIPRQLETICLKCLEKEPRKRYQTAQELADDLARFLRNEPIHARSVTRVERACRWCRRKPALAGLIAAVVFLLVAVAIGSTLAAIRLTRSERRATDELWDSYLAQARAGRFSGHPGRRLDSLEAIKKAVAIRPSLELRNEAIACLALLDLRVTKQWDTIHPTEPGSVRFDLTLERYAHWTPDGDISVRNVKDDKEVASVPCRDLVLLWMNSFSPGGRYLALDTVKSSNSIWDITRKEWAFRGMAHWTYFGPKGDMFATANSDGTISFYDLESRRRTGGIDVGSAQ